MSTTDNPRHAGHREAILAKANGLLDAGAGRAAVDLLVAAIAEHEDPPLETALVRVRHMAAASLAPGTPRAILPAGSDPFAPDTIPEVTKEDLTPEVLAVALARHGSLLVRGLIPADTAGRLLTDVRHAMAGSEAHADGAPEADTAPWYAPFEPVEGFSFGEITRRFARANDCVLSVESPRTFAHIIEVFNQARIGELLEAYLGEWPFLSAKKSTLRRATPSSQTDWHQDGRFLGADTRTVNVWVALTTCGDTAPSVEVIPHAFDRIVETGTDDAKFAESVSRAAVARLDGVPPSVMPRFAPGDALLFNQMTLHRTDIRIGMTDDRYAIESWFFAPSTYPYEQVPVLF